MNALIKEVRDDPDADNLFILLGCEVDEVWSVLARAGIPQDAVLELLELFGDGASRAERWKRG